MSYYDAAHLFVAQRIKPIFFLLVTYSLFFVAYFDSINQVLSKWLNDELYSHGFLTLLVFIYLYFQKTKQTFSFEPSIWAIAPTFVFSALWLIGVLTDIQLIEFFMLPCLIGGVIWGIVGDKFARKIFIPLCILLLATPGWGVLNPILQHMAVTVVGYTLDLIRIPALIENIYVTTPYGQFSVEGGCSGLRYLLVAGILGLTYAELHLEKKWKKIMAFISMVFAALVSNWVRVGALIVIGNQTQMQHSLMKEHEFFGWIIFLIMCLVVYFFLRRWDKFEEPVNDDDHECDYNSAPTAKKIEILKVIMLMVTVVLLPMSYSLGWA
ncbi:MAG: exosortase [Gammaproteobacteria bacterium]|nr:exosortase [Gammaproteobacteria bacterium]